ncbi:MAG: GYF domain-containing protein [Muribaculum sp.]|nr:GYF domain-containing protein [Muribaculum sp.]
MEKQYHIIVNGRQIGPLSFSDLLSNGLTRETLVWTPGMAGWEKAEAVADLAPLFVAAPPFNQPVPPAFEPQAAPPSAYQYYVIVNGLQQGPIDPRQFAAMGINGASMVWREGMAEWQPASSLPELIPYLGASYGNPVQNNGYQSAQNSSMGYTNQNQGFDHYSSTVHTNWMPWAIVATVLGALFSCIGMVFGIIAINKAKTANEYYSIGDDIQGDAANSSARTMTIIGLVIAGIGVIATIGIFAGAI